MPSRKIKDAEEYQVVREEVCTTDLLLVRIPAQIWLLVSYLVLETTKRYNMLGKVTIGYSLVCQQLSHPLRSSRIFSLHNKRQEPQMEIAYHHLLSLRQHRFLCYSLLPHRLVLLKQVFIGLPLSSDCKYYKITDINIYM